MSPFIYKHKFFWTSPRLFKNAPWATHSQPRREFPSDPGDGFFCVFAFLQLHILVLLLIDDRPNLQRLLKHVITLFTAHFEQLLDFGETYFW